MEEKKKPAAKISPTFTQVHVAIPTGVKGAGGVSSGLGNKIEHKFTQELHPAGVLLRYTDPAMKGKGKIIPYANIQHIDVEFEE